MIYSKGDAMRVSSHPEARNMSPSWSNKTRKFVRFLCIFSFSASRMTNWRPKENRQGLQLWHLGKISICSLACE
jgi:hypothetical protein